MYLDTCFFWEILVEIFQLENDSLLLLLRYRLDEKKSFLKAIKICSEEANTDNDFSLPGIFQNIF